MKAKDFLGMMKLGFILAIFAAAACIMLAFVYSGTKTIIDQRRAAELEEALKELFPDAENFEEISSIASPDAEVIIENAYAALRSGKIIGAALMVSRAGYSGLIKTEVGVNIEGFITGVRIMEHTDSPGFGANAASPKYFVDSEKGITFYGQFGGKHIDHPLKVNDDVIAITASTITSHAVSASVKAAGLAAGAWFAANVTKGGE